jgi:hypothetical protein
MAGHTLTTSSILMCPHFGTVQIISTNTRVRASGAFAALATDLYLVSGCVSGNPCLTVRWIVPDVRTKVNGLPTLSRSSIGICLDSLQIPQGLVVIINTQPRMQSQ